MTSVIIPAHNEEKVIFHTLEALLPGAVSGEIDVIIVCNGCNDNTLSVVASFGKVFKCIDTPVPSKTNALNLGDSAARSFPRIYQDADVILSIDAIRQLTSVLQSGRFLAVAPRMQMDTRNASWLVRSYYKVWQQMPYVREGMIGAGVYALSQDGRQRFEKFPAIIADDGYIRALFKTNERTSIISCYSVVRAPSNLEGLLKIKTRSRLGWYELKRKFPGLLEGEEKRYGCALLGLLGRVNLWPKILVYLYVNLRARFLAKKHARLHGFTGWARDDSSREIF